MLALAAGCSSSTSSSNPPADGDMPGDSTGSGSDGAGSGSDDGGTTGPVEPPPATDPVEPVWEPNSAMTRIKSPNQRMHFTAGLPFRILADGNDPLAYQCPPGHPPYACSDSTMTFYVDGTSVGVIPPDPANQNLWELRLPNGLPAGNHVLTVKFKPHGVAAVDGIVPIYITVDPAPPKQVVTLTQDMVLTGSTNLDWTNVFVKGNGHTVTAAPGYSGKIIIRDSFVTGLAAFDNQIGMRVTTTGGVEIRKSIFEATAPLQLTVNGSAPVTINNNELRSTNYVTYVSSDPDKSPILELSGNTSGAKTMQGNNIGAGIIRIENMAGWQIGGLRDSQSNIFVGPRVVLTLVDSPNAVIQGNYMHHDYYNGFSQGYNLRLDGGSSALAEHNVIRDSSWPLQSFGGELRYNLLINSGHDFVRSLQSGARLHHNIFAHQQAPNSGYEGGVLMYGGEQNVMFDNNTFDVGGAAARFDGPALSIGSGVQLASLRNNAFTQWSSISWGNRSIVAGAKGESSVGGSRITRADYNAWYNPLATNTGHYMPGIAGSAGTHDVSANPLFAGPVPQVPCKIDEGSMWSRTYGVSQLLQYYRSLYTPGAGSPLIDAGDPSDGAGNDIGAIGAGAPNAADKFGTVMQAN
ncbi:MAG TPA: right-handed parallel beta-helix repeat-containing protein [Kofleriaceae bacterium]|nr:right-handed parallel beta-helix repeat-containing protein [Kofleriaceae bacterium]